MCLAKLKVLPDWMDTGVQFELKCKLKSVENLPMALVQQLLGEVDLTVLGSGSEWSPSPAEEVGGQAAATSDCTATFTAH